MNILLLTHNHVVREFVEHAARELSATFDIAGNISDIQNKIYDFVFVDDRSEQFGDIMHILDRIGSTSVILYNNDREEFEYFDKKIKKPFLPADIKNVLLEKEKINQATTQENIEIDVSDRDTHVLNLQDIDEIKALLREDGLEIVSEEDLAEEIENQSRITDEAEETKAVHEIEEMLLSAILKMKPKKIRKLLKGAEVTLKIKFPKDSNE